MTIPSSILAIIAPEQWEAWKFDSVESQTLLDYISVEDWLLSYHGKPSVADILIKKTKAEISQNGSERQNKLKWYTESLKPLSGLTLLSGISLLPIIALKLRAASLSYKEVLGISLGLTLLFAFISGIWARKAKNLHRQRIEKPLEYYTAKKHTNHISKIHKTLSVLQKHNASLFVCEADGQIKRIANKYWLSDNWEIGLFLDKTGRQSISLIGPPPSGKFLLLKSELDKLGILKPSVPSQTSIHNRNKRDYKLQQNALQDMKGMRKVIKLIYNTYPKNQTGNIKGISKGKLARLEAMEYFSMHPKLWTNIRTQEGNLKNIQNKDRHGTKVFDRDINQEHKRQLLKIFANIARDQSTLGEPGLTLMEDFIYLKDRTLDNWLKDLGWKISG